MLVSIVMPAWRSQATIGAAVQSLLVQTHEDWEAVIAADDHFDYLGFLAKRGIEDRRLRCVPTERQRSGPAAARNRALAEARGEVIAVLDADDLYAPTRIEKLAPLAQEAGAAVDAVAVEDNEGRRINTGFPLSGRVRAISAEDILTGGVPLHGLFRRTAMPEGWPDVFFCDDVVMNLELLSQAGNYLLLPEALYRYRVHPQSICHAPDAGLKAEAAYRAVLDELGRGGFRLSQEIRAAAIAGFEERRARNASFLAAQRAGEVSDFQDFLARNGERA